MAKYLPMLPYTKHCLGITWNNMMFHPLKYTQKPHPNICHFCQSPFLTSAPHFQRLQCSLMFHDWNTGSIMHLPLAYPQLSPLSLFILFSMLRFSFLNSVAHICSMCCANCLLIFLYLRRDFLFIFLAVQHLDFLLGNYSYPVCW